MSTAEDKPGPSAVAMRSDHPSDDGDWRPIAARLAEALGGLGAEIGAADPGALGDVQRLLDVLRLRTGQSGPAKATADTLFFDVSDLLGYFSTNRLPTGIQRVQISLISEWIHRRRATGCELCYYAEARGGWFAVPSHLFLQVCAMSFSGADSAAPDWRSAVGELKGAALRAGPIGFPRGACLVNIGTSWWMPNYFMYVRQAKRAHGVLYVPLVHDVIPAIRPEFCADELVHEFFDWIVGVMAHADFLLTVSQATKHDLLRLATELGCPIPDDHVFVMPPGVDLPALESERRGESVPVARWGLQDRGYVLFVSTIEARKNQLGALSAWQALLARNGTERVPKLVLVGKRGFESDEVFGRLDHSASLRDHVVVLSDVTDAQLGALYRGALFAIYPSFYEGWGLPVTEALAHGRVALIPGNSSLPEAGCGVAMIYDDKSPAAFVKALEELAFDPRLRQRLEAAIAARFRPRRWADVAADLEGHVAAGRALTTHASGPAAPLAPGYYPLRRNRARQACDVQSSGEILRVSGWWRLEDFGSWTMPDGGQLALRLPAGDALLAFEMIGTPQRVSAYRVTGGGAQVEGRIGKDARRWVFLALHGVEEDREVMFTIAGDLTMRHHDPESGNPRDAGIGLGAVYVFDVADPRGRLNFVEAVALGGMEDWLPDMRAMHVHGRGSPPAR